MKVVYWVSYLAMALIPCASLAQEAPANNGLNLKTYCSGSSCKYIYNEFPIHYPNRVQTKWSIYNFELVAKKSGAFVATGDMYIVHKDTAVVARLEFLFVDENNNNIFKHKTDAFEFFNELGHAEPISFNGKMPAELVQQISFVDVEITYSKNEPVFEISSNCFMPCKELKLKDAIKQYKKSK